MVAVGQVIQVLEEGLLLGIVLKVVAVLLDTLASHVLSPNSSLLRSKILVVFFINHIGGHGRGLFIIEIECVDVLLDHGISRLCTLKEAGLHAGHSFSVDLWGVSVLSVLKLEDLVRNDILEVLSHLVDHSCFDKVVKLGVKLTLRSNSSFISLLFNVFVLRVLFEIGLEVVTVASLFLGQVTGEECEIVGLTGLNSLGHSLLTTSMGLWVRAQLTSVELFNLVENAIELGDRLLNFKPGLIIVTTEWEGQGNTLLSELTVNFSIGLMHSIKLLVCLL